MNEALQLSSAFQKDLKTFLDISWLLLVFFFEVFATYEVSVLVNAYMEAAACVIRITRTTFKFVNSALLVY